MTASFKVCGVPCSTTGSGVSSVVITPTIMQAAMIMYTAEKDMWSAMINPPPEASSIPTR